MIDGMQNVQQKLKGDIFFPFTLMTNKSLHLLTTDLGHFTYNNDTNINNKLKMKFKFCLEHFRGKLLPRVNFLTHPSLKLNRNKTKTNRQDKCQFLTVRKCQFVFSSQSKS